jgi:hypothetical protein
MRSKIIASFCLLAIVAAAWVFLGRAKRLGCVDSAIGSIRVLVAAETKFAQTHPSIGYTCTFSALFSDELTTQLVRDRTRNGYIVEISGCIAEEVKRPNDKYQITARPLLSEMQAFCSDESGIVRYDNGGSVQKCLANGIPL